jgi:hypothetical protein
MDAQNKFTKFPDSDADSALFDCLFDVWEVWNKPHCSWCAVSSPDAAAMKSEMSVDGGPWTPLMELKGTRVKQSVQSRAQLPAHLPRATLGQPLPIRLHQPACCVHQDRSSTHQFGPRPDHRQVDLRLRTARDARSP